ncbi:MAG: PD40 domain-containing protein [Phycisphaerae bacterium]|nr:PD40 domain-containing protein [Gemmatimonadaceae bacterium]
MKRRLLFLTRPLVATLVASITSAITISPSVAQQSEAAWTPSTAPTRLLRSPTVSAAHIAFSYAGNIWVVERSGGVARRLTSVGNESSPKLSPDGQWIAFSGDYGGNTDVYVIPTMGGAPKRLTWHASADNVQGWTPDGRNIVFASGRAASAPTATARFWTVAAAGGFETVMPMPRAYQGKISPDGKRVAYRMNSSWDEERRNYRGGQNRPVWIMDLASHDVVTPPWKDSKDMDPVWVGEKVYFISDRDGVANIWSYDGQSKVVTQHTRFRDFDVKTLDAGGGTLVFEQSGYVHELDPKTSTARKINISAVGDFSWMMPQWKDVTTRTVSMAISPTGRRAAIEARGEIFTVPAEKGDVRNMTASSGSAEILPMWSPDGNSVAYFSDKSGEYKLYIAPQSGLAAAREITLPEPSRPYSPSWSPDGRRIAFQDSRFRVWVVDVPAGTAAVADADMHFNADRSIVPVWSPDGRYLTYSKHLASLFRAVFVYDTQTGKKEQITNGLADATMPVWDASGKYLWFLASTDYGLNSSLLDMSAYDKPQTKGLYLAVLGKSEPSPLLPESDEEAARAGAAPREPGAPAAPRADTGTARTARPASDSATVSDANAARNARRATVIDFDGIQQRIIAVEDVALRNYTQLQSGPAGTVFFLEPIPASGTAGGGGGRGGGGGGGNTLHRYELRTRRAAAFAQGVTQYVVSGDAQKLLYRTGGAQAALFVVDAGKAVPAAGSGRLSATLRAYIDPRAEFKQIFDEGWRTSRNNLYVQNMHGTDWVADKAMYSPLLPHVMHRADLNYLMDMMGAEIAIGHSYVRGGDMGIDAPASVAGLLGADISIADDRYRIDRILESESWNPELRAPLAMPGVNVRNGDYILAINGVPLVATDNMYRLLDGTANRQTVLTVNNRPVMDGARQVTVLPIANEQGLRTRAWVEANRRKVDSLSGGRLAYVYIPNTGQPGYTSFNRYYFAQQDKHGVVVDERYNGGGSAADYIVDILGRDYDGYFNNPVGDRVPFTSPASGIWGPKVMIINEMAGSGGDLMPYMFKRRKMGPLVGTRTWGGLVATTDTPPFVDGGSMIAPRFGFFSRDDKWAVENEGVGPDIEVENWPKEAIAGHDMQLERAVQEGLRLLKENPSGRAKKEPPPPVWGKRIPPSQY